MLLVHKTRSEKLRIELLINVGPESKKDLLYMLSRKEYERRPKLHLSVKAAYSEFLKILKRELPKNSEVIRLGSGEYLVLGDPGDSWVLGEIGKLIEESALEYDELHPDKKMELKQEILIQSARSRISQ